MQKAVLVFIFCVLLNETSAKVSINKDHLTNKKAALAKQLGPVVPKWGELATHTKDPKNSQDKSKSLINLLKVVSAKEIDVPENITTGNIVVNNATNNDNNNTIDNVTITSHNTTNYKSNLNAKNGSEIVKSNENTIGVKLANLVTNNENLTTNKTKKKSLINDFIKSTYPFEDKTNTTLLKTKKYPVNETIGGKLANLKLNATTERPKPPEIIAPTMIPIFKPMPNPNNPRNVLQTPTSDMIRQDLASEELNPHGLKTQTFKSNTTTFNPSQMNSIQNRLNQLEIGNKNALEINANILDLLQKGLLFNDKPIGNNTVQNNNRTSLMEHIDYFKNNLQTQKDVPKPEDFNLVPFGGVQNGLPQNNINFVQKDSGFTYIDTVKNGFNITNTSHSNTNMQANSFNANNLEQYELYLSDFDLGQKGLNFNTSPDQNEIKASFSNIGRNEFNERHRHLNQNSLQTSNIQGKNRYNPTTTNIGLNQSLISTNPGLNSFIPGIANVEQNKGLGIENTGFTSTNLNPSSLMSNNIFQNQNRLDVNQLQFDQNSIIDTKDINQNGFTSSVANTKQNGLILTNTNQDQRELIPKDHHLNQNYFNPSNINQGQNMFSSNIINLDQNIMNRNTIKPGQNMPNPSTINTGQTILDPSNTILGYNIMNPSHDLGQNIFDPNNPGQIISNPSNNDLGPTILHSSNINPGLNILNPSNLDLGPNMFDQSIINPGQSKWSPSNIDRSQNIFHPSNINPGSNILNPSTIDPGQNILNPSNIDLLQNIYQPSIINPEQNILNPSNINPGQNIFHPSNINPGQNILNPSNINPGSNILNPSNIDAGQNILHPSNINPGKNIASPSNINGGQNIVNPNSINPGQNILNPNNNNPGQNILNPSNINPGHNILNPSNIDLGQNIFDPSKLNAGQNIISPNNMNFIQREISSFNKDNFRAPVANQNNINAFENNAVNLLGNQQNAIDIQKQLEFKNFFAKSPNENHIQAMRNDFVYNGLNVQTQIERYENLQKENAPILSKNVIADYGQTVQNNFANNGLNIQTQIEKKIPNHFQTKNTKKQNTEMFNKKLDPRSSNPKPQSTGFNLPCFTAADILADLYQPKHAPAKPIINPITEKVANLQIEKPILVEEDDDAVAIVFKPKNISLLKVYGDLLKKITLTVLVPYHVSKLASESSS